MTIETKNFKYAIAKLDLSPIVQGALVISKKFKTKEAAKRAFSKKQQTYSEFGYKIVELDKYKVNGIVAIPFNVEN